jgi:hypothetical protein
MGVPRWRRRQIGKLRGVGLAQYQSTESPQFLDERALFPCEDMRREEAPCPREEALCMERVLEAKGDTKKGQVALLGRAFLKPVNLSF